MIKSLCALARKPGTTRGQFQSYYEEKHAPLAAGLFPFSGYVRNHLIDAPDFGWDTISEFWNDDMAGTAALLAGTVGETMRADEEQFMDRTKVVPARVEEIVLSPGARADALGLRSALLVTGTRASADIHAQVIEQVRELAEHSEGVSVDLVDTGTQFPASAVIWLPGEPSALPDLSGLAVTALLVRRCGTAVTELLGTRRS
ncbi:EthD domain-containing protein [Novosphingobium sp. PP1Y]|uniref:EthD domain-containing protein n=1 Tax=Novosphingobium sp. PP1Y TaxID=702113 RepID=UPI00020EF9C9|nr:EthD domain-containing protein [Novosphingobium sp. PP1Y]CCA90282.1 ethyl tert-butyl ether degradation EthD [Novosphingobium sp. PP1Y]